MDKARAIEVLKEVAKKNQAANDMFHDFALRERARGQVTVRALYGRMKNAGFRHESKDYAEVLKALSDCGFGELRRNKRGNVVGLFNVRTTLQSIGQAIVGKRKELSNYAPRNKYSPLPASNDAVSQTTESKREKHDILQSLSGVDNLIRTILNDSSVPVDRRVDAALILLQK